MGIQLKNADITAVKRDATVRRSAKLHHAEPLKNSKNQRKEYLTNQLNGLYAYRDPKSLVSLCCPKT